MAMLPSESDNRHKTSVARPDRCVPLSRPHLLYHFLTITTVLHANRYHASLNNVRRVLNLLDLKSQLGRPAVSQESLGLRG